MAEIDVLMPVYNGAAFLAEAIDSIIAQSFTDFRLIIVNDGSTDATAAILQSYAERDRRLLLLSQENSGIVSALNRGLERVGAKYVFRMDADDIALPDRLALQRQILEAHPDMVMCGTQCDVFGAFEGPMRLPVDDGACRGRLLLFNPFAHSSMALRTEVMALNGIRYRESYRLAEDYKLWSELSVFGKIGNMARSLMRYRMHDRQSSRQFKSDQLRAHSRVSSENFAAIGVAVQPEMVERFLNSAPSIGNDLRLLLKIVPESFVISPEFWKCSIRFGMGKYARAALRPA